MKKEYKSPKLKKFEILKQDPSREEGVKQITRRRSLFNIASWFTPVVLTATLPAHARCSGGGHDDWQGWGHKWGHKRNWFDDRDDDCGDWGWDDDD